MSTNPKVSSLWLLRDPPFSDAETLCERVTRRYRQPCPWTHPNALTPLRVFHAIKYESYIKSQFVKNMIDFQK